MPLTIAVASLKGGTGKSTISLNLATCLRLRGYQVLLVDADSQGTCLAWARVAAEREVAAVPVVAMVGANLRAELPRVGQAYDVVIIDGPARLGQETRAALLAADLALFPTIPGGADIWALEETIATLREARKLRPELEARVVLNRVDRTTLTALVVEAVEGLGVPVLSASLGARVAFGESVLAGLGVVEYAARSPAAEEIEAVTAAVLAALEKDPHAQRKEKQARGRTKRGTEASPPRRKAKDARRGS